MKARKIHIGRLLICLGILFLSLCSFQSAKADENGRTVTIQNFFVKVYSDDVSTAVAMPDTDYTVSYVQDGQTSQVAKGITDKTGAVKNVTLKGIPEDITQVRIHFTLGNAQRGYVQKFNKQAYRFTFTKGIPSSNSIDYTGNTRFGNTDNSESYLQNYLATRINNYFSQAVDEVTSAIGEAHELIPSVPEFSIAPININFERGQYLDKGNAFYRNGHDGSGIPDIVLCDRSNVSNFSENYLKHNVMHEWTHWNLYRTANLPGGSYDSHYSYNVNPKISYKEGLALFAGEMFAKDYDLNVRDNEVQTDNYGGINRLYGKSTNVTVQMTLYDLLDVKSTGEDEDYYLCERYQDNPDLSEKQIDKLNFGVIYGEMMKSKATSLSEFLQYIQNKYVLTANDMTKFSNVLKVNGLGDNGDFTLDGDGNPLSTLSVQAKFSNNDSQNNIDPVD